MLLIQERHTLMSSLTFQKSNSLFQPICDSFQFCFNSRNNFSMNKMPLERITRIMGCTSLMFIIVQINCLSQQSIFILFRFAIVPFYYSILILHYIVLYHIINCYDWLAFIVHTVFKFWHTSISESGDFQEQRYFF